MAALVHCPQKKPTTLITVVMEAMPARATENLVDRLVFGDFGGGQRAGIEKLCDIFERFGARATFFVEYAATVLHGEEKIFKAAELLEKRGHDVQLHIHSEILVRKNLWPPQPEEEFPGWDGIDADIAQACAEFGVECFERNLGRKPRIFRPGGMKHSKALYDAVRTVGIEAVSALYSRYEQHLWLSIDKWPIFQFESLLGIDFEGGMENRRHQDQANSRNAFIKLMSSIPSGPNDVFVDVGCGTGKMLYYASQIGYRNCVGIEASEPLLHRAHGNLTRLRLQAEIKLSLCDTNRLAAGELSEGTVFYLSHPFTEVDLAGFLRNIAESQRIRPRTVRVVYYDSQYEAPFNPLGFRAIRSFETGNEGWIYDNSVIFEREPDATGTADSQHFILGVSMTSIDQTSDAIKTPADEFDVTHQVDTSGKIFLDDLTIVSGEKQTGAPVRQHNPIGSMPPCNTFLL